MSEPIPIKTSGVGSAREQGNMLVDHDRRLDKLESRAARIFVPSTGNWQNVIFNNGWADYGIGWQDVQFCKDNSGFIHLRGVMTAGAPGVAFTLPVGFRPMYESWCPLDTSGGISAIRISTNGDCAVELGSGATNSQVGLNITIPTSDCMSYPMSLIGSPLQQSNDILGPMLFSYHKNKFIIASGVGQGGNNVQETLAVLSPEITHHQYGILPCIAQNPAQFSRVDVRPGGLVSITGPTQLISFYNQKWPTMDLGQDQWTDLPLANGWVSYGTPQFHQPQFYRDESGWVHFRGLMKSGTTSAFTILGNMPIEYAPFLNTYMRVAHSGGSFPLSVRNDGSIVAEAVAGTWISLDHLNFHTR